jgi:Zn-dependent peptidase ImmA (M78 family)
MSKLRSLTSERRTELARQALRAAIRLRMQLDVPSAAALCVFDAAEKLEVELRFVDIPSMEGMYVKNSGPDLKPIILVSGLRPAGRQATTAGHELGHHIFGHGTRIDQYVAGSDENSAPPSGNEEEVLANAFAGFFLMPKAAVEHGFKVRGYVPAAATPQQIYAVAGWLGVGYGTLIHHMRSSLDLLSEEKAKALLSIQPKRIRHELFGAALSTDCFIVDEAWSGRPVDMQRGDVALLKDPVAIEGDCLDLSGETPDGRHIVKALTTGIGRIIGHSWAVFARVRPREFVGRSIFRHLESTDDDF